MSCPVMQWGKVRLLGVPEVCIMLIYLDYIVNKKILIKKYFSSEGE